MLKLVIEVDLAGSINSLYVDGRYQRVYVLATLKGSPFCVFDLDFDPVSRTVTGDRLRSESVLRGAWQLWEKAARASLENQPFALPPITVVVCTRDRAALLERCLASLRCLDYPDYEVLVIDNSSKDSKVAGVVARAGFRRVQESRPGLGWARNRGIEEAGHDIVSFIDEDAIARTSWLRGIARGFADQHIMAVTGPVLPAELETQSQVLFEWYGECFGMAKSLVPRIMSHASLSARSLLAAHECGVGTNMSFRRGLFRHIGAFDTALDIGMPTGGASDIDMFHRILSAGFTMRYEPDALIWHRHRRSRGELRRQIHTNGQAYGVYLLKTSLYGSAGRLESCKYACRCMFSWVFRTLISRKLRRDGYPGDLLWAELRGALHAPWAYMVTMRQDRVRRAYAVSEDQGMDA